MACVRMCECMCVCVRACVSECVRVCVRWIRVWGGGRSVCECGGSVRLCEEGVCGWGVYVGVRVGGCFSV